MSIFERVMILMKSESFWAVFGLRELVSQPAHMTPQRTPRISGVVLYTSNPPSIWNKIWQTITVKRSQVLRNKKISIRPANLHSTTVVVPYWQACGLDDSCLESVSLFCSIQGNKTIAVCYDGAQERTQYLLTTYCCMPFLPGASPHRVRCLIRIYTMKVGRKCLK